MDTVGDLGINLLASVLAGLAVWAFQRFRRRLREGRRRTFFGMSPDVACVISVPRHAGSNDGDAEAYAALFAPDAGFVDVLGRLQRGRTVIAREHEGLFASIYRGSTTSHRLVDERVVTRGVILAHSVGRLDVPTGPRGDVTHSTQTLLIEHGQIAALHNVVQSDLHEFAGHGGRAALVPNLDDEGHRDPRI